MGVEHDVLVVEDEPVVVDAVRRILEPEGFTVRAAGSAEDATRQLSTQAGGILLVDIVLPGISGLQLIELLHQRYPETVAISFSGLATPEYVVESLSAGAFDFVAKPFSIEELLGAVRRASALLQRRTKAPGEGPLRGPVAPPEAPPDTWSGYHFLGEHTWVRFEDDGSAVLGMDDTFAEVVADATAADYPGAFEELKQGQPCCRITTSDGLIHTVWCAVSGVVVESNNTIATGARAPDSGGRYTGTWLLRLWPKDRETEQVELTTYAQA